MEYRIMNAGVPSCIRVVSMTTDGNGTSECQEIMFRMQGVLTDVNLGPMNQ